MLIPPSETLTQFQQEVLESLFRRRSIRESFRLTGGTALAGFYLFHRRSMDLDLVTSDQAADSAILEAWQAVEEVAVEGSATLERRGRQEGTLHRGRDTVEVHFLAQPWRRRVHPGPPTLRGDVIVDALMDIAIGNFSALVGREDAARDHVDLFFITRDPAYHLGRLMAGYERTGFEIDRIGLSEKIQREIRSIEAGIPWEMLRKPIDLSSFREVFSKFADALQGIRTENDTGK